MSESVVARLRALAQPASDPLNEGHQEGSVFMTLLDIVEEMAAMEPYEPAIGERHELECLFCGELGDRLPNTQTTVSHTPDCPYRRARELCGMDQDGAS
jgi:hypothetical protein